MRILVTGANGFIGQRLCRALSEKGYEVRGAVRSREKISTLPDGIETCVIGEVGPDTEWQEALKGIEVIVHLAARVHAVKESSASLLFKYSKINTEGTKRLAEQAAAAGVRRFIFISSVKVNGEGSSRPYTEKDVPGPRDAYGISKMEAEQALCRIAAENYLQVVILRLPLVYGPGVKANFRNLIKIAGAGLPLPFKGIGNRRSFLYLENLIDAIIVCIIHPLAASEIFMISDGQDISTPELIRMIAFAMGKKEVLFSLDSCILSALCRIMGKGEDVKKLTGTLLVNSSKIRDLLGWKPPFTLEEGIKQTVKHYIIC